MRRDERVPHGWRTNPSNPSKRRRSVALSVLGAVTTVYLASFQLGVISSVWDPLFGTASRTVLTSPVSYVLSIPVSAFGSLGFAAAAATATLEGPERWRTQPCVAILFGATALTLGVGSVSLLLAQSVFVGAWSAPCLLAAAASLALVGTATDEMLASLQYLRQVYDYRGSLWRAFWKGSHVRSRANESEG